MEVVEPFTNALHATMLYSDRLQSINKMKLSERVLQYFYVSIEKLKHLLVIDSKS
jgi:hypothetical protein